METEKLSLDIEISFRAVIGCAQLYLKQKKDPGDMPVSEVISGALEGLIGWLEKNGQIPLVAGDHEAVYKRLFRIHEDFNLPTVIVDEPLSDSDSDALRDTEPVVDEFERTKELISAVEQRVGEHQLTEAVMRPTEPTETVDIREGTVDLERVNRMNINTLSKMAPFDALIQKCIKGIVAKEYIWAVEAVYTSLSIELWGTKTAEQSVNDLVKKHKAKGA